MDSMQIILISINYSNTVQFWPVLVKEKHNPACFWQKSHIRSSFITFNSNERLIITHSLDSPNQTCRTVNLHDQDGIPQPEQETENKVTFASVMQKPAVSSIFLLRTIIKHELVCGSVFKSNLFHRLSTAGMLEKSQNRQVPSIQCSLWRNVRSSQGAPQFILPGKQQENTSEDVDCGWRTICFRWSA